MKPLAWTAAVIYAVLVLGALDPIVNGPDAARGWALGGIAVPPVAVVAGLGLGETRRAVLIGVGLFVAGFLMLNAFVVT